MKCSEVRKQLHEEDPTKSPLEMVDRVMRHVVSCRACWVWLDKHAQEPLTEEEQKQCDVIGNKLINRFIAESN